MFFDDESEAPEMSSTAASSSAAATEAQTVAEIHWLTFSMALRSFEKKESRAKRSAPRDSRAEVTAPKVAQGSRR